MPPAHVLKGVCRALGIALAVVLPVAVMAEPAVVPQHDRDDGMTMGADRPRVALVLGGGGARGLAHIGALQVLEEAGVPVNMVVGTSMGAVIGGLYAAGQSPQELATAATDIDWAGAFQDRGARSQRSMRRKAGDRQLSGRIELGISFDGFELPRGAIQGQRLTQLLRQHLGEAGHVEEFSDLNLPFRAVAVDLESGQRVTLDRGDLALAIRASMSIPGVIAPVAWEDRLLIDGGLRANLPVEVAREMGADIVIAFDVGSVRPAGDGITGPFQVMDQAIGLMIRQNVAASIAALQPGDLYLRIDSGERGVTDFDQAESLVRAGQRAANAYRDELRELAIDPDEHATHLARLRRGRPAAEPTLRRISLDNRSSLDDQVLARHLDFEPGEQLDLERLHAAIDRIHGLGYFERVDYRVDQVGPNLADLEIVAEPQSWGPDYLRFGLAIEEDFDTRSSYRTAISYLRTEVNRLGAEFQADLELGSDPGIATEFWQPLRAGSSWYVLPRLDFSRRDVDLFAEGQRTGEVRLGERFAGLYLGRNLFGPYAELRAGAELGDGETETLVGDPDIAERDFDIGRYTARALWDSYDDAFFPRSGSLLQIDWRRSTESLGADDNYERITLNAGRAWSHGRNRWRLGLRGGTIGGTDEPPVQALHALGGFLNLGGYQRNALTGGEMALGQIIYLREVAGYRTIGGLPIFLGGAIETGNVWDNREERDFDDMIVSGTLIAAVETPLGPLSIGYGVSDDGADSAYLSLGGTF